MNTFKVVIWENRQLALTIKDESRRMFHQLLELPIYLYKNLKLKNSGVKRRLRDDNFLGRFVPITEC